MRRVSNLCKASCCNKFYGKSEQNSLHANAPSAAMRLTLRVTTSSFAVFMLGTPYIIRPPMRSARSNTCVRGGHQESVKTLKSVKPLNPKP